jgi:hypothetical protein
MRDFNHGTDSEGAFRKEESQFVSKCSCFQHDFRYWMPQSRDETLAEDIGNVIASFYLGMMLKNAGITDATIQLQILFFSHSMPIGILTILEHPS